MPDIEKGKNPANFKFQAPTLNVDGTPVVGSLLYTVYQTDEDGNSPTAYMQLPSSLNQDVDGSYIVPIENFAEGRWVIALTATDEQDDESGLSNTLGFSIGVAPQPPLLLAS